MLYRQDMYSTIYLYSTQYYSIWYTVQCTVYSERKGKLINRGSRFISHLYNVKREFHIKIPRLICVGNFLSFYPFVKNLSKLQKNFIKCGLLYSILMLKITCEVHWLRCDYFVVDDLVFLLTPCSWQPYLQYYPVAIFVGAAVLPGSHICRRCSTTRLPYLQTLQALPGSHICRHCITTW